MIDVVHCPVEHHVCEDKEFLSKVLGSNKSQQVSHTDYNTSKSDLDCRTPLQSSDWDDDSRQMQSGTFDKSHLKVQLDPGHGKKQLINQQLCCNLDK